MVDWSGVVVFVVVLGFRTTRRVLWLGLASNLEEVRFWGGCLVPVCSLCGFDFVVVSCCVVTRS